MPKIDQSTREQIVDFLIGAIDKALESYKEFTADPGDSDKSKDFKAHHDACKMALAHIQLLTKLSEWIGLSAEVDGVSEDKMLELITAAQNDVIEFESKNN